jgi:membrane fusion protein, macrolide-specific efflux system
MSRKLIAGALIAGLFVCATGCSKGRGDNAGRYLTADVETGDVERTVLSSGTLQPFVVVNVGAQATGQIQSLKVKLGDVVKRGQQLGVIDPAIQRNTLRNAEAALAVQQGQNAQQQAQLEKTLIDLNRQKALLDQGYASPAAYDQAAAQVALARAA